MFKPIGIIRGSKGITMIEAVIAMAVGLVGVMGGYSLFANTQGTIAGNTAVVQAQQEARNIVERIARELRESTPDRVWPSYMTYEESDYIVFYTPRDSNRNFIVDADGKPEWQRAILYTVDPYSHSLYRYQLYTSGDCEPTERFQYEIVSRNIDQDGLVFKRTNDMIIISVRTFSSKGEKIGSVADSYAEFYTMVKLRN